MTRTINDHQSGYAEPRGYAIGASGQVDAATLPLLAALNAAVKAAAATGADTGARAASTALLDALLALHQTITGAGRVLAARELTVQLPAVAEQAA